MVDNQKLTCPMHKGRGIILCCVDCDMFICDTCLLNGHKDHKLQPQEVRAKAVLQKLSGKFSYDDFTKKVS